MEVLDTIMGQEAQNPEEDESDYEECIDCGGDLPCFAHNDVSVLEDER